MRSTRRNIAHDLQGFAVLVVALLLGGFLLLRNRQSADANGVPDRPELPLEVVTTATPRDGAWQDVIEGQVKNGATPLPPTLIVQPTITPVPTESTPQTVFWNATPTPARSGPPVVGPTRPAPTAAAQIETGPNVRRDNDPRRGEFSPPPEQVPLSLEPRDHFWFQRPVNASANSSEIFWYVYGSDGPQNDWRVHHGVDLPNPIGKEVRAAADGRVIYAADKYLWRAEDGTRETAYTYGNVIVIEHNFGFNGQKLFTLYAHLQAILVNVNDQILRGQTIGLSGNTGMVSGPHVHFEVRVGTNSYQSTRNPILWMAPYENHGVIAGRILYPNGQPVEDVSVFLLRRGREVDRASTYVSPRWTPNQKIGVTPDDVWRENFVIGDVPVGDYQVVVNVNGKRYVRNVTVRRATTSFVDFNQIEVEPTPAG